MGTALQWLTCYGLGSHMNMCISINFVNIGLYDNFSLFKCYINAISDTLGPLLQTWIDFKPSIDK